MKKIMPWTNDLKNQVIAVLTTTQTQWVTIEGVVNSAVFTAFKNTVSQYLSNYVSRGLNVIGKWEYDSDTETYDNSGISALTDYRLKKYKPYLMVFSGEFSKIGYQTTRAHTGAASGVSRSAAENNPITDSTIGSAPTTTTAWDIDNPSMKSGSQHDNQFSNSETVTDPDVFRRVLEFNIQELNLTRIAKMLVNSLTEEYSTIY